MIASSRHRLWGLLAPGFLAPVAVALCLAAAAAWSAPIPLKVTAQAEQACADGDYGQALRLYDQVLQQAPRDPDALYNAGTILARQGNRGRATWRFLQALQLDPHDASLLHNLRLVSPGFQEDLGGTPIPPLNVFYWRLTANEWTALAAGATTLGLLLLASQWLMAAGRSPKRAARRLAVATLIVALAAWPPALLRYYQEEVLWRGVVVAEGVVARADPSDKAMETFDLPAGKIVRVLEQSKQGWVKIAFAGDRMGFVRRDQVEFL
jgi:tetratricopeptide (TPR) repeat protein